MTALNIVAPLTPQRTAVLRRRVRLIVAATMTYNIIEAIVAITAGTVASSAALVAFGLDSLVEVTSAAAVAWQYTGTDPAAREHTTLRLIAGAFFELAAYVTYEAISSLLGGHTAGHSTVGITLAALSVAIMPFFSWFERRTGRELGSASVIADSTQTLLCAWLSGVLPSGWWPTACSDGRGSTRSPHS